MSEPLKCQRCGTTENVTREPQRTQYPDPEANFATLCPPCHEENNAYWDERWAEVQGGYL